MDDFPNYLYRLFPFVSFLDGIGYSTPLCVLEMCRIWIVESITETSAEYRTIQWCLDHGNEGREGAVLRIFHPKQKKMNREKKHER